MKKAFITLFIMALAMATPASAGWFDWLSIAPQQPPAPEVPIGNQAFMEQLYALNTPEALNTLNSEFDASGVNSVKVLVNNLPWESSRYFAVPFYVVRGLGVVQDYAGSPDKIVLLRYDQVERAYPILEKGRLDFFDRWQLYMIYST